jgi:hypothetical protein
MEPYREEAIGQVQGSKLGSKIGERLHGFWSWDVEIEGDIALTRKVDGTMLKGRSCVLKQNMCSGTLFAFCDSGVDVGYAMEFPVGAAPDRGQFGKGCVLAKGKGDGTRVRPFEYCYQETLCHTVETRDNGP